MFSFSEDMLPRHFPQVLLPKSTAQLDQTAVAVPRPTLPSVSLIFANDNNVDAVPSFRKWKNQLDHARPKNDAAKHQAKSTKKHVRFENVSQEDHSCNIGRCFPISRKEPTDVAKPTAFALNFRQYDRALTSELIHENCFTRPFCMSPDNQFNGSKSNEMTHREASTDTGFRLGEQKRNQLQSCDEILLNILEEQQRHISFQRKQIAINEKQNLEQQKQICILQRRIRQLLLQHEADDILARQNGLRLLLNNETTSVDMSNESMNLCGGGTFRCVESENMANEKMIPNIGLISSDGALRGCVNTTKNSFAIFNSSSDVNSCTAEAADSVTWNPHKLMGALLQCSTIHFKEDGLLISCNQMTAEYLFMTDKLYDISYDTGDKVIQCGRHNDIFKLWLQWRSKGTDGFGKTIDTLMDLALYQVRRIKAKPDKF